jgi:transcriptional regulator with XRE-family HTH domain
MELQHPFDAALRARLRSQKDTLHQAKFAKAIGRSPGWLHKYMHGTGSATLDDAIRMAALLIGLEAPQEQLSELERRVVKNLRSIPSEIHRADVARVLEQIAKNYREGQPLESNGPSPRKGSAATRKGRQRPSAASALKP